MCYRWKHFSYRCHYPRTNPMWGSWYTIHICFLKRSKLNLLKLLFISHTLNSWGVITPLFSGSCKCWSHQEANLLCFGIDKAHQGRTWAGSSRETERRLWSSCIGNSRDNFLVLINRIMIYWGFHSIVLCLILLDSCSNFSLHSGTCLSVCYLSTLPSNDQSHVNKEAESLQSKKAQGIKEHSKTWKRWITI